MRTCYVCGRENLDQAVVCAFCYAILSHGAVARDPEASITLSPPTLDASSEAAPKPERHTAHVGKLDRHSIALYMENIENPVILQVISNAFLGRASPEITLHPILDLTPFDGYAKGVSRTHAAIQRQPTGFALVDMNSTNGSWVNDFRLLPQVPKMLKSGDVLRLSKLRMVIYLPDETAH